MKYRVTRHHSTGSAARVKDPLYPGFLFKKAEEMHLFVETQADDAKAADEGGLAISMKNGEWHVAPLGNEWRKIVIDP